MSFVDSLKETGCWALGQVELTIIPYRLSWLLILVSSCDTSVPLSTNPTPHKFRAWPPPTIHGMSDHLDQEYSTFYCCCLYNLSKIKWARQPPCSNDSDQVSLNHMNLSFFFNSVRLLRYKFLWSLHFRVSVCSPAVLHRSCHEMFISNVYFLQNEEWQWPLWQLWSDVTPGQWQQATDIQRWGLTTRH